MAAAMARQRAACVLLILWVSAPLAPGPHPATAAPLGGSRDVFGYTWTPAVLTWIDASAGQLVGAAGDDAASGPLALGFDFPFYEKRYAQVYVSTNGLLTFGQPTVSPANTPLPQSSLPNNSLAVFWDDLAVGAPFNSGEIRWLAGGSAPERFAVIEWRRVSRLSGAATPELTFQVILNESGSIVLQYLALAGPLDSATVGIEDEQGTDGLSVVYNAAGLASGLAVRLDRPPPAARLKIYPTAFGAFAGPENPARFDVPIRNAGDLAADTFDLTLSATWPAALQAFGTGSAVIDTDADGLVDTGRLAPGAGYTLTVLASPPGGTSPGAFDRLRLTVSSSLAPGISQTVDLDAARAVPLAQVARETRTGEIRFLALTPWGETLERPTAIAGRDAAISAAANGAFLLAWRAQRCNLGCSALVSELGYALLDQGGLTLHPATRLTNHLAAPAPVFDMAPAPASAPAGPLAVAWRRVEFSGSANSRENIYLALLDDNGERLAPPVSLTRYATYGPAGAPGVPRLGDPRLAATGDGHFVVAWEQQVFVRGGASAIDIIYASVSSDGTLTRAPTSLTAGVAGGAVFTEPTVAALGDSLALLAYNASDTLAVAVVDSAGSVVQPVTPLGVDGARPDAAPLGPTRVLLAWSGETSAQAGVLRGTPLGLAASPAVLDHPQATTGETFASAASTGDGRGVVTWIDAGASNFNLYYALLDTDGAVLTPPLIWRRSLAGLDTSRTGYGSAPHLFGGWRRLWFPSVYH